MSDVRPGFVVVLGEQPVPVTVKDDNCLSMDCQWVVKGLIINGLTANGLTISGLTVIGLTISSGLTANGLTANE